MLIEPLLLQQLLDLPSNQDITRSPIATNILLPDPANAALLISYLDQPGTKYAALSRRLLCNFDGKAVPFIMDALLLAGSNARIGGIEIISTILQLENIWTVGETLAAVNAQLTELLQDRRPLSIPEGPVEIDFRGRICDLLYLVLVNLINPLSDQSEFRGADDSERDRMIANLKLNGIVFNNS